MEKWEKSIRGNTPFFFIDMIKETILGKIGQKGVGQGNVSMGKLSLRKQKGAGLLKDEKFCSEVFPKYVNQCEYR